MTDSTFLPQRQCLLLEGEGDWLSEQAANYFDSVPSSERLWLSNNDHRHPDILPIKRAAQQLGCEFSLVIFDAQSFFDANAFAAVMGSLKAGGLLLILMPRTDNSFWLRRFKSIYQQYLSSNLQICLQGQSLPLLSVLTSVPAMESEPSLEQQQAIDAVLKVVHGHRRRPLVISSDRGRGKSSLLGMAAAKLLQQGKQRIVITAPSSAQVEPFFHHASQHLTDAVFEQNQLFWQQGEIEFLPPDVLIQQNEKTDLLIIDEAAAIPVSMLEKLLTSYSRIVFSTTVFGYEGTGRGFALRFQKTLDAMTPDWRQCQLTHPIRWAVDDQLEAFSFDALLLNATAAEDQVVVGTQLSDCQFKVLEREQLLQDEATLRQIFGLMVLSHYRTRPSDLQLLLDEEAMEIAVLRHHNQIVAACWLINELPMSAELAEAVYQGKRKLKGQLLPQSLLLYSAITDAAELHYQRIVRIAVHPACQGRGLGSHLLSLIVQQAKCDVLGTSYALDADVYRFWRKNKFSSVRLGHHADQVTGSVSLMMLQAVTEKGLSTFQQAQKRLSHEWPYLLSRSLAELDDDMVTLISTELYQQNQPVDDRVLPELHSFAFHQRPYESVQISLWQWLITQIGNDAFNQLSALHRKVLIQLLIQQRELSQVVKQTGLTGRAQLIQCVREAVTKLL